MKRLFFALALLVAFPLSAAEQPIVEDTEAMPLAIAEEAVADIPAASEAESCDAAANSEQPVSGFAGLPSSYVPMNPETTNVMFSCSQVTQCNTPADCPCGNQCGCGRPLSDPCGFDYCICMTSCW